MKFPNPYLPKSQFGWSLKNRQLFAKYYWNPWLKVKWFCEKWLTRYGLLTFFDMIAFKYLVWSADVEKMLESRNLGWRKM